MTPERVSSFVERRFSIRRPRSIPGEREGGGRPDQGSRGGAMAEKGESSPELVIKAI